MRSKKRKTPPKKRNKPAKKTFPKKTPSKKRPAKKTGKSRRYISAAIKRADITAAIKRAEEICGKLTIDFETLGISADLKPKKIERIISQASAEKLTQLLGVEVRNRTDAEQNVLFYIFNADPKKIRAAYDILVEAKMPVTTGTFIKSSGGSHIVPVDPDKIDARTDIIITPIELRKEWYKRLLVHKKGRNITRLDALQIALNSKKAIVEPQAQRLVKASVTARTKSFLNVATATPSEEVATTTPAEESAEPASQSARAQEIIRAAAALMAPEERNALAARLRDQWRFELDQR